jgi:uncharacterized protein (DUF433 family)
MPWYDEHVVYGDAVLRPYLKETGIDVHKIIMQVDEDDKLPQEAVQEHYDVHELLDTFESDSNAPISVGSSSEFDWPKLNVEHVEAAIDYFRDHKSTVKSIIQEQAKLTEIQLQSIMDAHEDIQQVEFQYFGVDSTLSYQDDGTPVVEFEYQQ